MAMRPATVHFEQMQLDLLKLLSLKTGIPAAKLHREGVDAVLRARAAQLPSTVPVSAYEDEEELERLETALRDFRLLLAAEEDAGGGQG